MENKLSIEDIKRSLLLETPEVRSVFKLIPEARINGEFINKNQNIKRSIKLLLNPLNKKQKLIIEKKFEEAKDWLKTLKLRDGVSSIENISDLAVLNYFQLKAILKKFDGSILKTKPKTTNIEQESLIYEICWNLSNPNEKYKAIANFSKSDLALEIQYKELGVFLGKLGELMQVTNTEESFKSRVNKAKKERNKRILSEMVRLPFSKQKADDIKQKSFTLHLSPIKFVFSISRNMKSLANSFELKVFYSTISGFDFELDEVDTLNLFYSGIGEDVSYSTHKIKSIKLDSKFNSQDLNNFFNLDLIGVGESICILVEGEEFNIKIFNGCSGDSIQGLSDALYLQCEKDFGLKLFKDSRFPYKNGTLSTGCLRPLLTSFLKQDPMHILNYEKRFSEQRNNQ